MDVFDGKRIWDLFNGIFVKQKSIVLYRKIYYIFSITSNNTFLLVVLWFFLFFCYLFGVVKYVLYITFQSNVKFLCNSNHVFQLNFNFFQVFRKKKCFCVIKIDHFVLFLKHLKNSLKCYI